MTKTYVMSTPRSGLNWVRTCVETFSGRATPGKMLIHKKPFLYLNAPFIRSHDPGGFRGKSNAGAWRRIKPRAAKSVRVAFLIRDPRELFGREVSRQADAEPPALFFANVDFYAKLPTPHKAVFYYEDFVKEPAAMAEVLAFLDIQTPDGKPVTAAMLADRWDEMGSLGRSMYDKNQAKAGGSTTQADPYNFTQHQAKLTEDHLSALRAMGDRMLDPAGKELIRRYGF